MIVQKKIGLAKVLLSILAIVILPFLLGNNKTNSLQAVIDLVDPISIKQQEMLAPIVRIKTHGGTGSGIIIDRLETNDPTIFKYLVLTSSHIVNPRLIEYIVGVDSLTGKARKDTVDTVCSVMIFNHSTKNSTILEATVIAEDVNLDLALLSFDFDSILLVAKIADENMLDQIRVFDEVFAIGCQLGRAPIPTVGVISEILLMDDDGEYPVNSDFYGSTTNMAPGSSGGGLFKKYDGHYYLIGVSHRLAVISSGQIILHIARSVAMSTVKKFIDEERINNPCMK